LDLRACTATPTATIAWSRSPARVAVFCLLTVPHALIEKPSVAQRILRHLRMRDHPPPINPPRFDNEEHAA